MLDRYLFHWRQPVPFVDSHFYLSVPSRRLTEIPGCRALGRCAYGPKICSRSVRGLKAVADPSFREDQFWTAGIDFEQTAEMSDMHIQYPRIVPVVCLPDTVEQFVTRHGLASPSHEQSKYLAGDGRKLVEDTINLEPSRSRVQRHTLCLHNVGRISHQGRLDRLDQLVHCERPGQESIHLARNRLTGLKQSQHGNLKAKFQARHAAGTTRRRQVKDRAERAKNRAPAPGQYWAPSGCGIAPRRASCADAQPTIGCVRPPTMRKNPSSHRRPARAEDRRQKASHYSL